MKKCFVRRRRQYVVCSESCPVLSSFDPRSSLTQLHLLPSLAPSFDYLVQYGFVCSSLGYVVGTSTIHIISYHILYQTILYHTILYHTILYHTILYHTISQCHTDPFFSSFAPLSRSQVVHPTASRSHSLYRGFFSFRIDHYHPYFYSSTSS